MGKTPAGTTLTTKNTHRQVDISTILEANKGVKRLPWERRQELIQDAFGDPPEAAHWVRAFDKNLDIMGDLIQDLVKVSLADHHTDGPRPRVGPEEGMPVIRQLFGLDYSYEPFEVAFRHLIGNRSMRHVASKVGLSAPQVCHLLNGKRRPSLGQMEMIAKAFGKAPAWFLDYRVGVLSAWVEQRLRQTPEISVKYFQQVSGKR